MWTFSLCCSSKQCYSSRVWDFTCFYCSCRSVVFMKVFKYSVLDFLTQGSSCFFTTEASWPTFLTAFRSDAVVRQKYTDYSTQLDRSYLLPRGGCWQRKGALIWKERIRSTPNTHFLVVLTSAVCQSFRTSFCYISAYGSIITQNRKRGAKYMTIDKKLHQLLEQVTEVVDPFPFV